MVYALLLDNISECIKMKLRKKKLLQQQQTAAIEAQELVVLQQERLADAEGAAQEQKAVQNAQKNSFTDDEEHF